MLGFYGYGQVYLKGDAHEGVNAHPVYRMWFPNEKSISFLCVVSALEVIQFFLARRAARNVSGGCDYGHFLGRPVFSSQNAVVMTATLVMLWVANHLCAFAYILDDEQLGVFA